MKDKLVFCLLLFHSLPVCTNNLGLNFGLTTLGTFPTAFAEFEYRYTKQAVRLHFSGNFNIIPFYDDIPQYEGVFFDYVFDATNHTNDPWQQYATIGSSNRRGGNEDDENYRIVGIGTEYPTRGSMFKNQTGKIFMRLFINRIEIDNLDQNTTEVAISSGAAIGLRF